MTEQALAAGSLDCYLEGPWPIGGNHETCRMLRVRLKADGRIVEILPDGSEQPRRLAAIAEEMRRGRAGVARAGLTVTDADYARGIRARSGLTQAEFAARIGVPLTVRNWEQGKRSPRARPRAAQADRQGARRGVRGSAHRWWRGGGGRRTAEISVMA